MKSARFSKYFIPTLREDPKEAEIPSHKLMIRSGMIRKLASGIYEFLPLGWRVVKKIENIIRRRMDEIDGQELFMSALQPRELWDRSGRWDLYGPELFRLQDRQERDFCLGPTHEEVVTSLVASDIKSYKSLPVLLYQFQMKFRDEIRPRFGVMRAREFYMKDAYSFDSDEEGCLKSYRDNVVAYIRIFKDCGLNFIKVEAATGNIGGSSSHEFMVPAGTGEDEIACCSCGYGANTELSSYARPETPDEKETSADEKNLEKVNTPGKKTVEEVASFLNRKPEKFIKTLICETSEGPAAILIRGDHELNLSLAASRLGNIELAGEERVKELTGASAGFAGPSGLKGKVSIIAADRAVTEIKNGVSGANENDFHLVNINYSRDYEADIVGDFRTALPGDLCPVCGKPMEFKRGIEIGHTFLLGEKYSESMGATFTDAGGTEKNMMMGCYGIGVTRIAAAAIEQSHDKEGIIWPVSIAPFHLHIIQISDSVSEFCSSLFEKLSEKYEVLLDDRRESPGIKFKDALLIGCPIIIVVGKKFTGEGKLEIQCRHTGRTELTDPDNIEEKLREIIEI